MRSQRNSNIKHRYHQKKALPRVPAFPVKYNFAPFFLILGSLKLLCKTLICEMFQSSDSNSLKRTSAPERKTPNSGSSGGSVETSATQKCDGEWSQDPHVYQHILLDLHYDLYLYEVCSAPNNHKNQTINRNNWEVTIKNETPLETFTALPFLSGDAGLPFMTLAISWKPENRGPPLKCVPCM